jgi:hypothetical protein
MTMEINDEGLCLASRAERAPFDSVDLTGWQLYDVARHERVVAALIDPPLTSVGHSPMEQSGHAVMAP